ncbi:Coenzyme A ligase [hydrothermal vent metagenome]|uniref:Coenzyme A ligase n=1 Tax=hydrothermal vent metagenome TaxID=652676 RepID=A0A3B0UM78_9ZZZZ
MIWNEAVETMPRAELESLQSERLAQLAAYVYQRTPFYKQKFDELGIKTAAIKDLRDLTKLPFTRKSDLRDNYPFDLFAVPMDEIIRVHASSGTTGQPIVVGYTRDDLQIWAEVCARCFALSGAKPGDMFQNAYGYGLFTGGLGMHYGAETMGLTVIPVSGGNSKRQIMLLQDFQTDIMACTPSYALTLADKLMEAGIDSAELPVRSFILGAEPWTEGMRQEIESKLHVDAVNIYGLSEIIGPGVSNECVEAKDGMHIMEDHFLPEIINPDTGESVADGEIGELVITTLTKQAIPLLRYRTGDLCSITHEICQCGRSHARMSRILGRTDDMLVIRGINLFPTQIEAALIGLDHLTPHHRIIINRKERLDTLEVQVEVTEAFFRHVGNDALAGHPETAVEDVQMLESTVQKALHETLGLSTKVTMLAPGNGPRSEGGKLNRVVDKRVLG